MTYNPATLTTVTLPEGKWHSIRTAVLVLACDERLKGNHDNADHWLKTYDALKDAMDN